MGKFKCVQDCCAVARTVSDTQWHRLTDDTHRLLLASIDLRKPTYADGTGRMTTHIASCSQQLNCEDQHLLTAQGAEFSMAMHSALRPFGGPPSCRGYGDF